jgi:hypothetical protein
MFSFRENSRIDYFIVVIEDTLSTSMLHVIGSCLDRCGQQDPD